MTPSAQCKSFLKWIGALILALLLVSLAAYGQNDKKPESSRPSSHHSSSSSGGGHQSNAPSHTNQPSQPHAVQNSSPSNSSGTSNQGRRFGQSENSARPASGNTNPGGQTGNSGTPPGRRFGSQPGDNSNRNTTGQTGTQTPMNRPQGGQSPNFHGGEQQGQSPNFRTGQPGGQTPNYRTGQPNGNANVTGNVRTGGFGSHGTDIVRTRSGGEIHRDSRGAITQVRTPNGAVIHHAPDGVRRVEVVRPGNRVVVASSTRYGYVQRPLVVNNVTYVQRTYVYNGVSYARVYRPWVWGGVTFHVYTPAYYYRPAFYTWAWTPWARPVYFSWGWAGRPWYGYYGGWFTPYPYYTSPAFWLTDYLIATTLEEAYQERMAADAAARANAAAYSGGQVALTPDVKQAIADEVHRQLEQERSEQGAGQPSGSASFFTDNGTHVFVVSAPLQVDDGSMGCALTEGDVLQMNGNPPPNSSYATVAVLASKGQDCRKGSRVQVALNDLVEMQNQMRATVDQGLKDLQSKQGQNGIPALPSNAAGGTSASFAAQVRPDDNAATELRQAAQDADRAEQDVVGQASDSNSTVHIGLGMTIADIEQALGQPKDIADLGSKKIYVYRDMKITFIDGKVSDVQ